MLNLRFRRTLVIPCTILVFATATTFTSADSRLDAEAIGQAAGAEATATEDGVVRVGWSRDDVPVTVDGLRFPPAAGLGSWVAFKALPDGSAMVMGDTVVFEDEITPAMDAAFANGLEVAALHNHFVFDRPPAYFMHVGGHAGDAVDLASGVRAMWDAIRRVRSERKVPAERSASRLPEVSGNYDVPALESILGQKGSLNGQVLKFTFERAGKMHYARVVQRVKSDVLILKDHDGEAKERREAE